MYTVDSHRAKLQLIITTSSLSSSLSFSITTKYQHTSITKLRLCSDVCKINFNTELFHALWPMHIRQALCSPVVVKLMMMMMTKGHHDMPGAR